MSQVNAKKIKLGDSADTSKNFLISVPTVPDGTLTIERENGTDVLTVDASGKVKTPGNIVPVLHGRIATYSVGTGAYDLPLATIDTNVGFTVSGEKHYPTVAGWYQVNLALLMTANAATSAVGCAITSSSAGPHYQIGPPYGNVFAYSAVSALIYCNGATDWISFQSYTTATGGTVTDVNASAVLVRAA